MHHFKPAVVAVFLGLFAFATAGIAPPRAFAQVRKPEVTTGKAIGVSQFRWGMTSVEILAVPLGNFAKMRALPGKDKSFQIDNLQLFPNSIYGWTLQLWLDKKGLSAFELRPTKEIYTNKVIGYPDEAIAAQFQQELSLHIENAFKIKPDQWWQNSDQAQVRVKTTRSQTSNVETPGYLVPSPSGSGPAGYIPPSSYPVTRYYKQFSVQPVTLFFSIKDRAWSTGGNRGRNQYRQGYLFNSKGALSMAVVRLQGRREGKPFEPVTGGVLKTKDSGTLIRAIFKNYNVNPENL